MSMPVEHSHDFFRYRSGRWVWDEEEHLHEIYHEFNVFDLQRVAVESEPASACVRVKKLAEGSYNKSFHLTIEDGSMVVARLPNPNVGPGGLTTASEVATMNFE